MADNVAITAGAGTNIATDDAAAGGHVQIVKLAISADGSATVIPADATNGIDVDVTRVQGSVTVDSELPAAAALSDSGGNPTTPMVGGANMQWDGTNWVRMKEASAGGWSQGAAGMQHAIMTVARNTGTYNYVATPNIQGDGTDGGNIASFTPYVWNGATYDRAPGNAANGMDVDVTRMSALVAGTANIGDVDVASLPKAATATTSQVADTASSATLLASNAGRLGATITNDSSARLYVRLGAAVASTTNYSFSLAQHESWEPTDSVMFTGEIRGIWATDPGDGGAKVTELTA